MRSKLRAERFDDDAIISCCGVCGGRFQFGPDRYAGKFIARYQIKVCEACFKGAWDGWGPSSEAKIIKHCGEKGLLVSTRNAKGWLPRE